ncbi:hypothetical protein [Solirubrobacter soli]|uniref:hypothetical protein n=1 Tax=Solirubrobacter soli TaxID=363832 RepID=UPI0003F9153F|nr:hypothetical protein [Solirubrobacter soli]
MTDIHTQTAQKFCTGCGAPATGKFCANCGTASGVHSAISALEAIPVADEHPEPRHRAEPAEDATRPAGKRGWALPAAIAGGIAVVSGAAVVFVLASSGSKAPAKAGPDENVRYQQKVADAFGPVLGANEKLSKALVELRVHHARSATRAVSQAKVATTAAQGALTALTAPPASTKLAGDARQVIDRETAYLNQVALVLKSPSVAGASSLQALSSNLNSAFHTAGPVVAGQTVTVSGADSLARWAHRSIRKPPKHASVPTPAPTRVASPSAPPGRSCGDGLFANSVTTCGFAQNVRDAYYDAPGRTNTLRVYSPSTGQTYTMNCAPSGDGTTCSGGNDASVTF